MMDNEYLALTLPLWLQWIGKYVGIVCREKPCVQGIDTSISVKIGFIQKPYNVLTSCILKEEFVPIRISLTSVDSILT